MEGYKKVLFLFSITFCVSLSAFTLNPFSYFKKDETVKIEFEFEKIDEETIAEKYAWNDFQQIYPGAAQIINDILVKYNLSPEKIIFIIQKSEKSPCGLHAYTTVFFSENFIQLVENACLNNNEHSIVYNAINYQKSDFILLFKAILKHELQHYFDLINCVLNKKKFDLFKQKCGDKSKVYFMRLLEKRADILLQDNPKEIRLLAQSLLASYEYNKNNMTEEEFETFLQEKDTHPSGVERYHYLMAFAYSVEQGRWEEFITNFMKDECPLFYEG